MNLVRLFATVPAKVWLPPVALLAAWLLLAPAGYAGAQLNKEPRFSLNLNDATLDKIFKDLEITSGYQFRYTDEVINDHRKFSYHFNGTPLNEILEHISKDAGLEYRIGNKNVAIKAVNKAQPRKTIRGKVIDTNGEPLPGVTIRVKGTTSGTISDADGLYSIEAEDNDVLEFTFIGMASQEMPVNGVNELNVTMQMDAAALNEVVVIGYGSVLKKDVTGAISQLSATQIAQVPTTNVMQALQGRLPGVVVQTQSWTPGSQPQVRIRGNRSITASNEPLYVVDGVPLAGGANEISPWDIESIQVLKDASATAIYGTRGANGVILITTKKGKEGKTTVEYNGYYGLQRNKALPRLMNAAEFVEYSREAQRNSLGGTYDPTPNKDRDFANEQLVATPYMLANMERAWASGTYDPSQLQSTDWLSYGLQTGHVQDHQISVKGGTEQSQVNFSTSYFNNVGVVKDLDFNRYIVRLNLDHKISRSFRIGAKSQFSNSIQNAAWSEIFEGYGLKSFNPLASPYGEDGKLALYPTNNTRTPNPVTNFGSTKRVRQQNRFLGAYYAEASFLHGFTFKTSVGIDYRGNKSLDFNARNTASAGGEAPSSAANQGNRQFMYSLENILNYNNIFNENHSLFVTLVQSIQSEATDSYGIGVRDLPYDHQKYYNVGSALTISGISSSYSKWSLASFMGRINYSLKDKYLATISTRYDGSSRLADGHKWVAFPSVALAWRIKNENFMQGVKAITDLKLRAGWGRTGNSAIDPYKTWGTLSTVKYIYGDTPTLGFDPLEMINPNLTWETTEQYNIGLDFALANSRITGSIEVYNQDTYDLLLARQLPTATGFTSILSNIGKTNNKGIELSLSTVNVSNSNMQWTSDVVFSTNKQKIVELYNGKQDDVGNLWFIGKPVNIYYDLKPNGIWQDTETDRAEMAKFNANGAKFKPGDIRPMDKNGDYAINGDDRYLIGQQDPKWTISLNNTVRYKAFDLSLLVYAMVGQTIAHDLDMRFDGRYNQPFVDYWTPQNPGNKYPRPLLGGAEVPYLGTLYYHNGSFFRVRNVSLGYSLPQALSNKLYLQRLRVYATVQNPLLITNFPGTDPEGSTGFNEPSVESYMLGVNLSF